MSLIRPYVESDYAAVADVYRDAVESLARVAYTEEQVRMWASFPSSSNDFRQRLNRGDVLVAEEVGIVVAFGQLEPEDHVAFLYCRGAYARRGLASAIYARLETCARAKGVVNLWTEASRISRAFFVQQGFNVTEIEQVVRLGVQFERFKMVKILSDS